LSFGASTLAIRACLAGGFAARDLACSKTGKGRVLPTADVGYAVAQLGGQLSGGEIANPADAGRPTAELRGLDLQAANRTSMRLPLGHCCDPAWTLQAALSLNPTSAN
jgi:hypothetical protein